MGDAASVMSSVQPQRSEASADSLGERQHVGGSATRAGASQFLPTASPRERDYQTQVPGCFGLNSAPLRRARAPATQSVRLHNLLHRKHDLTQCAEN